MMKSKTKPMVKSDIYFHGNDFHFEQKEVFAIQALIAPNQKYIYSKQMGANEFNYFKGEYKKKLWSKKDQSNETTETTDSCFWIALRDLLTTKLNHNGIRVDVFDLSDEGIKYGEITINIEGVRINEVY